MQLRRANGDRDAQQRTQLLQEPLVGLGNPSQETMMSATARNLHITHLESTFKISKTAQNVKELTCGA
jgi:hypothetical protein